MASRKPETAGPTISEIERRHDRLLVLDIDEVVLEFIDPFVALLGEVGARLRPDAFRLTGSVHSQSTGAALGGDELKGLMHRLYEEQSARQMPVAGVVDALVRLAERTDIVFLTAMAPRWHETRRRHLDASGLPYPMIATERDKGAVICELQARWPGPIVFVDDLPSNLEKVRRSTPRTRLLHLMASRLFWPYLPGLPSGVESARTWPEAEDRIGSLLSGE